MKLSIKDENLKSEIKNFIDLYREKPLDSNHGGMGSPHMFATYCLVKNLKPKTIIESGVWYGQGSWLLNQSAPKAKLICIEPLDDIIKHTIAGAEYHKEDFSDLDFDHLDKDSTLLFFDDHQNAFERIKLCKELGFKHLIFEDNYPPNHGDCISIKKILSYEDYLTQQPGQETKYFSKNKDDTDFLKSIIKEYYEFPPLFKTPTTRWGDAWSDDTKDPILSANEKEDYHPILWQEKLDYTWICYVNI